MEETILSKKKIITITSEMAEIFGNMGLEFRNGERVPKERIRQAIWQLAIKFVCVNKHVIANPNVKGSSNFVQEDVRVVIYFCDHIMRLIFGSSLNVNALIKKCGFYYNNNVVCQRINVALEKTKKRPPNLSVLQSVCNTNTDVVSDVVSVVSKKKIKLRYVKKHIFRYKFM